MLAPLPSHPRTGAKSEAKTRIGKAIEVNEKEIKLAIAGLVLQIDDKLSAIKQERPNSEEAIAARKLRISDYERIRAELEHIREIIAQFRTGEAPETKVVKSVTTFGDGIRKWWQRGHESICNRTYDAGLFLSSVSVLSLMNADMKVGMIITGALVGGKSIASAIKVLPKKLSAIEGRWYEWMQLNCRIAPRPLRPSAFPSAPWSRRRPRLKLIERQLTRHAPWIIP